MAVETGNQYAGPIGIDYATRIDTTDRYAGAHFSYNGYLFEHGFQAQALVIVDPREGDTIRRTDCSIQSGQWYAGTIGSIDDGTARISTTGDARSRHRNR